MSPRRNRSSSQPERGEEPAAPLGGALRRVESYRGEDWIVQTVAGTPGRFYRCPGCDQEISPGAAHLVAWPAYSSGPADRRHWHNPCWQRRLQRHTPSSRGRR